MTWDSTAQWIAIAFSLALSILVPLFTQIANNRYQLKLKQKELEFKKQEEKRQVYTNFLLRVGSAVVHASHENLREAGAALYQVYTYAPAEWWDDLDQLALLLQRTNFSQALILTQKLSHLVAEELNKESE